MFRGRACIGRRRPARPASIASILFRGQRGRAAAPYRPRRSGGELSRVLLALVASALGCHAKRRRADLRRDRCRHRRRDRGGGRRADRPARARRSSRLRDPPGAARNWADRHYVLDKTTTRRRPRSRCAKSRGSEREAEIARMLSGETHDAALQHARALQGRVALTGYGIWWIFRTLVPPAPTGMPVVNAIRSPDCTRPARRHLAVRSCRAARRIDS